jgi:hypothetical protein
MGLGSEIRDPEKIYSGSRIQGSERHRIQDPDPQHCYSVFSFIHYPVLYFPYTGTGTIPFVVFYFDQTEFLSSYRWRCR